MIGNLSPKEEAQFRMTYLAGITLYTTQRCERILGECLTFHRADGASLSAEDFFRMEEQHRNAALGELRGILRDRFNLPDDIATRLKAFADNRNTFVHRLFWQDGFDGFDPAHCDRASEFIESLRVESESIASLLSSALRVSWVASGRTIPADALAYFQEFPKPPVTLHELFPPR